MDDLLEIEFAKDFEGSLAATSASTVNQVGLRKVGALVEVIIALYQQEDFDALIRTLNRQWVVGL